MAIFSVHFQDAVEAKGFWGHFGLPLSQLLSSVSITATDGYMVGANWLYPGYAPEFQERSECPICLQTETMEYILTESGQLKIWQLAEKLWGKGSNTAIKPDLGTRVLGTPAIKLRDENNTK